MKYAFLLVALLVLLAGLAGFSLYRDIRNLPPRHVGVLETPGLTYYSQASPPFVQITWNYNFAPFFNIYRATSAAGPWTRINSQPYPKSGHSAVDYDLPADTSTLFYRITSADKNGADFVSSPTAGLGI